MALVYRQSFMGPVDPWLSLDGRLNAPSGGSFQQSNFFSYARQSGQTYVVRPPWQVAGVDYPVGISAASFPLKDPTIGALPSGAIYNPGAINPNTVICSGSGQSIVFDGWDFSVTGINGGGIIIQMSFSDTSSTVTFKNCKFRNGSFATTKGQWIWSTTNDFNLVFQYNDVDLGAIQGFDLNGGATYNFISVPGLGSFTCTYNRIYNSNRRMFLGLGSNTIKYNYFEGHDFDAPIHGEWIIFNSTANATCPLFDLSFNCFLQPANFGGGLTAPIYLSTGQNDGTTFADVEVRNNTCVVNYATFTGYIGNGSGGAGTIMTVTSAPWPNGTGSIGSPENLIPPVTRGITVSSNGTGSGGAGTYNISSSQLIGSSASPVTLGFYPSSAAFVEGNRSNFGTVNSTNNYIDGIGVFSSSAQVSMFLVSIGTGPTSSNLTGNTDLITGSTLAS